MSIINYHDPTVINFNLDDNGQPVSVPIVNETKQVVDGKIPLEGLPDEQYRIQITGYVEINVKDKIDSPEKFKCDYTHGILYFDQSLNGQTINIDKYYSRGQFYTPSSRVWTKLDSDGTVTETLKDVEIEVNKSLELSKLIQTEENQRISNENTRVANENIRGNAESDRVSNETNRKSNESARESNELTRVQNENNRKGEESTRKTNESARISNEDTRQTNETTRINAEDLRKSNETARENNEGIRQNQEQDRQTNTTNAVNEVNNTNNNFKVWEDYDNLKDYVPMNKVQYQGSSYVNVVACKGVLPTDTNHWQLVALKGQDGVGGDMYKSTYDTNNNGRVDVAENAEKLEGKTLAEIYADIPEGTTVTDSTTNGNILVNGAEIQAYDDTLVNQNISNLAGIGRTTETVKDNSNKINILNDDLLELKYSELSSTATNIDDEGIYQNIEWKRKDNTLYAKSTLIGTTPNYNQIKIDYYNETGTTIIKTITWDLTYDDNNFPYTRTVI